MPIQGWQNARLCIWRDIWMHEPCFWPLGPQTQSSGENRTETGTEERHWSTGDGAGHCLECGEEKGMTQALFLPTRSLKSRERAKDINIWHGRWQNVSSGSGFWQLEVFLVFLHSKLSLSGRKKTHYQHLEKDFYLWPKVSLSVFSVKKKNPCKKWTFQTGRRAVCMWLIVLCGYLAYCIQKWCHNDGCSFSKTVESIPFRMHLRMELGLWLQQLSSNKFIQWIVTEHLLCIRTSYFSFNSFQCYSDFCRVYSLCARNHPTSDYVMTLGNP